MDDDGVSTCKTTSPVGTPRLDGVPQIGPGRPGRPMPSFQVQLWDRHRHFNGVPQQIWMPRPICKQDSHGSCGESQNLKPQTLVASGNPEYLRVPIKNTQVVLCFLWGGMCSLCL